MDWSYVAGYFDGEGHVSMHPVARGGFTRGVSWYNNHLDSLEQMREFIGCGSIQIRNHVGRADGIRRNAIGYALTVSNRKHLIGVLDSMIPYLIIKRDQAIALREHLDTIKDLTPAFGKCAAVSSDQLKRWYFEEQKSCAEIGAIIGVSDKAVYNRLKRDGLTLRRGGGIKGKPKPEATRQRMKESRRALWQDPEFRATQLKNFHKDKNWREKHRAAMYARWQDPEFREKQLENLKHARWGRKLTDS